MSFKHLLFITLIDAAPVMPELVRRLSEESGSAGIFGGIFGAVLILLAIYAAICFCKKPTDRAFCMKCQDKVLFRAEEKTTTMTGGHMTKGTCPSCKGGVCTTTSADGDYNGKPSTCECFSASLTAPFKF